MTLQGVEEEKVVVEEKKINYEERNKFVRDGLEKMIRSIE